jgi:hypothetical protein
MHFLLFVLVLTYSFSASAEANNDGTAVGKAQIIRLCENAETGEQIESPLASGESCPNGFTAYDDLTPVYIEAVKDIPPPKPLPEQAEKEAYAE